MHMSSKLYCMTVQKPHAEPATEMLEFMPPVHHQAFNELSVHYSYKTLCKYLVLGSFAAY
jgi:hypothetical protein